MSLDFADPKREDHLKAESEGLTVIEVVVTEQSRINGKTSQSVGLTWRRQTVLLGISRRAARSRTTSARHRSDRRYPALAGAPANRRRCHRVAGLPAAGRTRPRGDRRPESLARDRDFRRRRDRREPWLDLPAGGARVRGCGFVLTRILPLSDIYTHIEWPVVVLLGSMIPLGAALETSGGTELIADALTGLTAACRAWAMLTVLMVVTMTLSDVLNNTATVIVAAPVGIQMAETLGVNADPFLMAVAVAASCAFLTPIGHKNNTLILGPGGYGFGDYWRMGLPLEIIVVVVSIPAILLFWPL